MRSVELIETPRRQYFNGSKYYRDNSSGYYVNTVTGIRMHVDVWTKHYGPVPKGCHIHHVDDNPANNDITNLVCLTARDHARIHAVMTPYEKQCEAIAKAIAKAPEWHKSEEGRRWHALQYEKIADKLRQYKEFTCAFCGNTYEAINNGSNKYCSKACRYEGYNRQRREKRKLAKKNKEDGGEQL